jgi:hypothetical protein
MPEPVAASCVERDIDLLHAQFVQIMPGIETHARIHFRHLHCPCKREDAI